MTPQSLDVTGLPVPVVDELRRLVATLRSTLTSATPTSPASESADEWALRLEAWVETHPPRPVTIDDSRESLYAGRGG